MFQWLLASSRCRTHPVTINVDNDGLSVTFTVKPLDLKAKDRYRDPPDMQSCLVKGFAQDRCGREAKDDNGKMTLSVTLEAKI
jgi:hypothetical protein